MLVTGSRLSAVKYKQAFDAYLQDKGCRDIPTDEVDPQRLYELQHELDELRIYTQSEVDGFAAVFFKLPNDKRLADHAGLDHWLSPAKDRFEGLKTGPEDEAGEARQEAFRGKLTAFGNLYGFLGHVVPFADADLEKLYAYGRMLLRKLPRPDGGGPFDPGDDVVLASFKLKLEAEGDLTPSRKDIGELPGPEYTGSGKPKPEQERLSAIIDIINERFGTDFDAQDPVDGVTEDLVADQALQQAARVNDKGNFEVPFREALDDALVNRHEKHGDFINKLFEDEALGTLFRGLMLEQVYERLIG
jgi:type I restriction enzyme R subunit